MNFKFYKYCALLCVLNNSFATNFDLKQANIDSIDTSHISVGQNFIMTKAAENNVIAVNAHGVIRNGVRDPDKTYTHSVEDFELTLLAQHGESNLRPFSLAWSQDMTKLYGISRNSERSGYLFTIDPSTGVSTEVAKLTGLQSNDEAHGITIDENDQCYISTVDNANHDTRSSLYKCNLSTGALTFVGTQTVAPDIHDIVATCDGIIYGTDAFQGKVYEIDKLNGEVALLGDANYGGSGRDSIAITYDRNTDKVYQYVLASSGFHTAFAQMDKRTGAITYLTDTFIFGNYVGAVKSSCPEELDTFVINPGLNGSWYNPETGGQGFFLDVLPESKTFFLSWFTYENMVVDTTTTSNIGNPGNRWLTALGTFAEGNLVDLTINNTAGGLFNDPALVETNAVGTMTVEFTDCKEGFISFDFNDSDINGVIPIQRIGNDNVELCESYLNIDK